MSISPEIIVFKQHTFPCTSYGSDLSVFTNRCYESDLDLGDYVKTQQTTYSITRFKIEVVLTETFEFLIWKRFCF